MWLVGLLIGVAGLLGVGFYTGRRYERLDAEVKRGDP